MDTDANEASSPAWSPPRPFSERFAQQQQEMRSDSPHPQTPPSAPIVTVKPKQAEVTTAPIPVPTVTQPAPQLTTQRQFQLLSPDELSEEEIRAVEIQMTAFYYAQQYMGTANKLDPPLPYHERFFIWKMIFQVAAVIAVTIVALVAFGLFGTAVVPESDRGWIYVSMAIVALVGAWFVCRAYFAWRHTFIFSTPEETGLRRPIMRWLLLPEIERSLTTAALMTKDAGRSQFTAFFNINSWQITLDSPAQKDDFLVGVGFVRDGNRLKKTVNANQVYFARGGK